MSYFRIINELGDVVFQSLTHEECCRHRELLELYFTDYFEIQRIEE